MDNQEWEAIERWEERMFDFYNRCESDAIEQERLEAMKFESYIDTLESQLGEENGE